MYRLTKKKHNNQTNKQTKLSLWTVPSGVAILSHMYSIAKNILLDQDHLDVEGKDNEFLSFISKKRDGVAT